jgi:hypothetical protein
MRHDRPSRREPLWSAALRKKVVIALVRLRNLGKAAASAPGLSFAHR